MYQSKGDKNMEAVGIIREMDDLGRVVIPKEWRDLYKFEGPLEIVATAEGVLIRHPKYKLVERKRKKR